MPNNTKLNNIAPYEELSFSVENQNSAKAFNASPIELNPRLPYMSANLPLSGLKIRTTMFIGTSMRPAAKAL